MLEFVVGLMMMPTFNSALLTVPIVHATELTNQDLIVIATDAAERYGLHKERFLKTFQCEVKTLEDGTWDYKAQSDHHYKGVREDSWGMWQINLYWNPTVTKEQAQDPWWSTEWSAQEWSKGNAWKWACWHLLSS